MFGGRERPSSPAVIDEDGWERSCGKPTADEIMALTFELFVHDVRSPLLASRRALDDLLAHATVDDPMLSELAEALGHIDRMTNELLVLERLRRSTAGQPLALGTLVQTCATRCSGPHAIEVSVAETVVEGDQALLEAAISNLVENALRHARERVRLWAGPAGDGTLVTVDDDGPGVPPSLRELIFRPLVRLDPDAGEGLGLGLSLVRRVAQLHGGRVWADDAPGGGARFCFWLPPIAWA
jgi:signal transduction histidine kinase